MLSPHESLVLNAKRGLLGAEARQPRHQRLHPGPVRRPHRLPSPAGCSRAPRRVGSATRAASHPTDDVLHHRDRRPDAAGRRRQRPDPARRRSSPSTASTTTACASATTAARSTSPTSATPPTALRRRRPADPRRLPDPGPRAEPRGPGAVSLSWPEDSIPQAAEPFTRNGHRTCSSSTSSRTTPSPAASTRPRAPVGAARIIHIDDPRHPKVVSNLRLAVHQPGRPQGRPAERPRCPEARCRGTPPTTARCRPARTRTWWRAR